MSTIQAIILVVLMLLFVAVVSGIKSDYDKEAIQKWAAQKGYHIQDVQTHLTTIGTPFYYNNKNFIYEIRLTDGQVWFMRPSIFGDDYAQNN